MEPIWDAVTAENLGTGKIHPTPTEKTFIKDLDARIHADSGIANVDDLVNLPPEKLDQYTIRADIIRAMCSQPADLANKFPPAIRIRGYRIQGKLDLSSLDIPFHLIIRSCVFTDRIDLREATIESLNLVECRANGIDADGLTVSGDLKLSEGFASERSVCLTGARIGGDLICTKGHFRHQHCPPDPPPPKDCEDCHSRMLYAYSLVLNRIRVGGSVNICGGFTAIGGVLLADAHISGNLNCTKGVYTASIYPSSEGEVPEKQHGRRLACEADDPFHRSGALNADGIYVGGNMLLNGAELYGEARLIGAVVDGSLECAEGRFHHKNGNAICGDRMRVRGNLFLCDKFTVEGAVRLPRAEVGADVSFYDGNIEHHKSPALQCDGIRVQGTIYLMQFTSKGEVSFSSSVIGGTLNCNGSKLTNPDGVALRVDNAHIAGSLFMTVLEKREVGGSERGFKASGSLFLESTSIGKDLICTSGEFKSASSYGINAPGINVGGKVELKSVHVDGGLNLEDAVIAGSLTCSGAKFYSRHDDGKGEQIFVINGAKLRVGGSVYFNDDFVARGWVRMIDASIGMNFNCEKGKIENKTGFSLHAQRISVRGTVHLNNGFEALGAISLRSASIGVDVDCSGSKLCNPIYMDQTHPPQQTEQTEQEQSFAHMKGRELKERNHYALSLEGAQIGGSALFRDGCKAEGIVSLKSAQIGIDLDCGKADFVNQKEEGSGKFSGYYALNADGVKIKGSAHFRNGFHAYGTVSLIGAEIGRYFSWLDINKPDDVKLLDLRSAKAEVLMDAPASWPLPGCLETNGFQYQYLAGRNKISPVRAGSASIRQRIRGWIEKQQDFYPQPYQQLSWVLQRSGLEEDARVVLIAMNRRGRSWSALERKKGEARAEEESGWQRFVSFLNQGVSWLWGMIFKYLAGYGYRPVKALIFSCFVIAIGTLIFREGFERGVMKPTKQWEEISGAASTDFKTSPPKAEAGTHSPPQSLASNETAATPDGTAGGVGKTAASNPADKETAPGGSGGGRKDTQNQKNWYFALIYTLDTFLPVVNLRAEDYFVPTFSIPEGKDRALAIRLYILHRLLIVTGWLTVTALLAAMALNIRR